MNIVPLFGRVRARKQDWSQAEIAEFYRIEGALIRAGIMVGTDRGLTDEGDPWFVFFRADDGEVVIHLARIDGEYVLVGSAYQNVARGPDFGSLVRDLIDSHPMVRAQAKRSSNVRIHPAAMLIAIIGAAFFKSGEARADDGRGERRSGGGGGNGVNENSALRALGFQVEARQAAAILASVFLLLNGAGHVAESYRAAHQGDMPDGNRALLDLAAHATTASGDGRLNLDVRLPTETAEMLSKALALLAVLKDLQRSGAHDLDSVAHGQAQVVAAVADSSGEAQSSGGFVHADALPAQLDHLVVELLLTMDALPDVEAVRLIKQVAPGLAGATGVAVTQVEHLPDALMALIRAGIHAEVRSTGDAGGGAAIVVGDVALASASTVSFDQASSSSHLTAANGSAGGFAGSSSNASGPIDASKLGDNLPPLKLVDFQPVGDTSQMSGPKADVKGVDLSSGASLGLSMASVDAANGLIGKFVKFFLKNTTNVDVIVSGREIVLVDETVLSSTFTGRAETVTFKLVDGSSISLVGQSHILHDTLSQWG
jgi:hypothetical protein